MSVSSREAYTQKIQTDLMQMTTKISILEAAAKKAPKDASFDYRKRITDLREEQRAIEARLEEMQEGKTEDWKSKRTELTAAVQELEDDISKAMSEAGLV